MTGAKLLAWLAMAGALCVFASGLRMAVRPAAYLGRGSPPATDPRTVRIFGCVFIVSGLVGLVSTITRVLEG